MRKTKKVTTPLLIPVSMGEVFDKRTILEIKSERISDPGKLAHVRTELALLGSIALAPLEEVGTAEELAALQTELLGINKTLWDLENKVRALDRAGDHGPDFVSAACAIYANNDRRAAVKLRINQVSGSAIVEEKEHG